MLLLVERGLLVVSSRVKGILDLGNLEVGSYF